MSTKYETCSQMESWIAIPKLEKTKIFFFVKIIKPLDCFPERVQAFTFESHVPGHIIS
jgi:hypothetical protein